ncbi:MAG: histidine phosphatase family protein [Thiohalocapsa sp.]
MTIFLVRHGETEWNRARRYQGWQDSPLTARGVAQAEAIGHRLKALPAPAAAPIVASPTGRARRTAEIIAGALGAAVPLRFDPRLREISLGAWDGLDRREIRARLGAGFVEFEWYFATPHGQRYDEFAALIAEWLREVGEGPVIAVTHGVATRVLRGLYAGLAREEALRLPVPQDCIFALSHGRIEEIIVPDLDRR